MTDEHRGLTVGGVMMDCQQEICFCAFPLPPEQAPGGVMVGDCVEVMRFLEAESIDAIVTDPPYGFGFMGRAWDKTVPLAWATEALRVLKPGGHLLAFGGTRTYHRLTCGIEDAGFEIRDCLSWLYGSGFPKSLDVSKAIDKAAGAEREVVGSQRLTGTARGHAAARTTAAEPYEIIRTETALTAPATEDAIRWQGWGTALKPGWEPCVVARKPLRGTVAANVAEYGTGALNIDACRIESGERASGWSKSGNKASSNGSMSSTNYARDPKPDDPGGRWPANVALDEEAARLLDEQSGERTSGVLKAGTLRSTDGGYNGDFPEVAALKDYGGDTGGASRFFYTAKASRSEREAWGRMSLPAERRTDGRAKDIENPRLRTSERVNDHPTVKPLALMEWLIKLVLPPGGLLLDPFCGSGSTLVAARRLNVRAIGIEQDERSAEIARQRIAAQWEVQLL